MKGSDKLLLAIECIRNP